MTLLLVDDEQLILDGMRAIGHFEECGIEQVLMANSMQQAQELMKSCSVDIVICDIEMPGGSGLELISWINGEFPTVITIILSSHMEFDFARQAVSLSCMDYILKPATREDLARVMQKAVQQVLEKVSQGKLQKIGEEYVGRFTGDAEEKQSAAEQVQKYILEHLEEDISVEKLAAQVYLSQNHLAREFKKRYNCTIVEYMTEHRLSMAEELLKNTQLSVTQVSARVGYPNYAYFTRIFHKAYGMTPSEWRNKYGKL